MPAEEGGGLPHSEDLAPIKPATEPDQGEAGGVGGTPWHHLALLIQRELLTEQEVFGGKGRAGAPTETEEAPGINEKRAQYLGQWTEAAKQVGEASQSPDVLLRCGLFSLAMIPAGRSRVSRCFVPCSMWTACNLTHL